MTSTATTRDLSNGRHANRSPDVTADVEMASVGGHVTQDPESAARNVNDDVTVESERNNNRKAQSRRRHGNPAGDNPEVVETGGKDEPDRTSIYSLYMNPDLRYYLQHPYSRLAIAYLIIFCNFYMYAEDPIAHSYAEASMPVLGNVYCFIALKYPPNAWSLLKVILWLSGLIVGCVLGKRVVHSILLKRVLRLKMFRHDQGSWLTMAATTAITLFLASWLYNLLLLAGGDSTKPYRVDQYLGMSNSLFGKMAAFGTWSGDFITAWIVTDVMLQDQLYPHWARRLRTFWNRGCRRIIAFWFITVIAMVIVLSVIATDVISWDYFTTTVTPTNEAARSFLASFILVMDLLIVMQDWDFPYFINAMDLKLPGLNTASASIPLPACLRRKHLNVHITGKWMNYGVIIIVMFLDLNMWQTQMFHTPFKYAQYLGPDGRIYSVRDEASLTHNETILTYDWRSTHLDPHTGLTYLSGDHVTEATNKGFGLGVTCLAFIPCVVAFGVFIFFIFYFGREKPTKLDPHAGRLKKRRKMKFSLKRLRASFRRRRSSRRTTTARRAVEAVSMETTHMEGPSIEVTPIEGRTIEATPNEGPTIEDTPTAVTTGEENTPTERISINTTPPDTPTGGIAANVRISRC